MGAFNLPGRSGNGHPKRAPERTHRMGRTLPPPARTKACRAGSVGQVASLGFPTPSSSSSTARLA